MGKTETGVTGSWRLRPLGAGEGERLDEDKLLEGVAYYFTDGFPIKRCLHENRDKCVTGSEEGLDTGQAQSEYFRNPNQIQVLVGSGPSNVGIPYEASPQKKKSRAQCEGPTLKGHPPATTPRKTSFDFCKILTVLVPILGCTCIGRVGSSLLNSPYQFPNQYYFKSLIVHGSTGSSVSSYGPCSKMPRL